MSALTQEQGFGGIPGAQVRNYEILIYFNTLGDHRYEVRGEQLFYVEADTVMHDGAMTPRYRLAGQLDRSSVGRRSKATEGSTWGGVKALFR